MRIKTKDELYYKNYRNEYTKERYKKLKKEGICVDCGFREPLKNIVRCKMCSDLLAQRQYNARLKKIEEGRCVCCGKPKDTELRTCSICTDKNRERSRKFNERMRKEKCK